MSIKDELLFDFAINMPRLLVSGKTVVIDNVKALVLVDSGQIVINNGKKFTSLTGGDLTIDEMEDERILVTGEIKKIEFYGEHQEDKG